MYQLNVCTRSGKITQYQLDVGVHTLGKDKECDVVLLDRYVSRRHAELVLSETAASIHDVGSTNGIWHNAQRIIGHRRLDSGDSFQIGELILTVSTKKMAPTDRLNNRHDVNFVDDNHDKKRFQESDDLKILKQAIHAQVLEYLDLHKRTILHTFSTDQLRREARQAAKVVMANEKLEIPEYINRDQLTKEIVDEAIGLGPIEPLLADDTVTEIMINGEDHVYVERGGKIEKTSLRFSSTSSVMSAIERIVTPLGRRVDEASPMVDARLSDGSRVNAIIPPLSLAGPVLTIRKFAKDRFTIDRLVELGTLSKEMASFLEICVRSRRNIVVSGGTGSGKTTTLNVLSDFIPDTERIITIEDAAELQLSQQHVVSLESRPPNVEGKGLVSVRDLVRNALRMRPDRIVIGECRGGEALDMLQAMNTGHDGSLTTGHANSARDFLSRLEVMVLMSGMDLPVRAIREQIVSAIDVILQQTRFSDGTRRITGIAEVDGMEGDVILLQPIFEYRQSGRTSGGAIVGQFTGLGYAPSFYVELESSGEILDRALFGRGTERSDAEPLDYGANGR